MKLLVLAILSALGCAGQTAPSCAYVASEAKPDDPSQFTMAVLESLSYAKSAFRPSTLSADADPTLQLSDLIFRLKAADLDYGCAAELLGGYRKSKDVGIALTAVSTVLIFQSLIDMEKGTVVLLKSMSGEGSDKISPADLAENVADLRLRRDETWSGLPVVVPGLTQALVSRVPDGNGKLSFLRVTTQQRRAIIQKLEKDFGPAVKGGVKEEQDPVLATAAMFYTWISDKRWKNSDGK